MPATRIHYILTKQRIDRRSPKTVEDLVSSKKYFQKPLWECQTMPAQFFRRAWKKIQAVATTTPTTKALGKEASEKSVRLEIPKQVSLVVGENNNILVSGIRGSLVHTFPPEIVFEKRSTALFISSTQETTGSIFSTQTRILYRMLVGVTKGYKEKIKTSGVGYRAVLEEKQLLTLFLGYSHRAHHRLLPSVTAKFSRKSNKINFSGPSWPAVSATAAEVYHLKKPDVYNGKGVRYRGLPLRKKEGKKQSR